MKTISIAINGLKQFLVEIKLMIFIFIIAPLLFSYLYGAVYQKIMSPNMTLPKFNLVIVDNDKSDMSSPLEEIFKNNKLKSILNLSEASNISYVKDKLLSGDFSAAIIIPKNFSSNIRTGKTSNIEILKAPSAGASTDIVDSIVNTYTKQLNINIGIYSALLKSSNSTIISNAIFARLSPKLYSIINKSYVNEVNLSKKIDLNSKQQFSLNILIMFSLFIAVYEASNIIAEKEFGTLKRIESTSTSKFSFCFGKYISSFIISFILITSFVVISKLLIGVYWGNLKYIALIIFMHSILISALTALLGSVFKTGKIMRTVASLAFALMSIISGSFYPTMYNTGLMKTISQLTINYVLNNNYSNVMLGYSLSITNIIITILVSLAIMVASSLYFRFLEVKA